MPDFGFPGGAGGGGGGGGLAVIGGSGASYPSIANAIVGETETVIAGIAAGAGTAPGIFRSVAIPVQPVNFYKDFWVVVVTAVPGNGLVCRYARVSAYDGIDMLTLDQPWDLTGETIDLISPIRLGLTADLQENVTITKNIELDLGGHRLRGSVDVTVGDFCWIRGEGWITDGIQKTNLGVLRIDGCSVSRRGSTIYAVLMTEGSDLGRCELTNCRFFGRVAGRRGRSGWMIDDCVDFGVTDGVTNVAYALVESVGAVAITLNQLDVQIDSDFGGAFLYSENSITGGAAYISLTGDIREPKMFMPFLQSSRKVAFAKAVGGATLTVTATTGGVRMNLEGLRTTSTASNSNFEAFSFVDVLDFTGTASLLISGPVVELSFAGYGTPRLVLMEGATMSGSVTLGGTSGKTLSLNDSSAVMMDFRAIVTGTVTISGGLFSFSKGNSVAGVQLSGGISQVTGAPVVTISAAIEVSHSRAWTLGSLAGLPQVVSVGTWTFSGAVSLLAVSVVTIFNAPNGVAGGTWIISGAFNSQESLGLSAGLLHALILVRFTGSAGSVTVSGPINVDGGLYNSLAVVLFDGVGGSVSVTGATTIKNVRSTAGINAIGSVTTAGGSFTVSGAVIYSSCRFDVVDVFLNATLAGGSATGPASLLFEECVFAATATTQAGAGTLAWGAAAALRFKDCHVEGLFTLVGTPFTTVEAFETFFNGNSGGKSISASGARPATYRLWSCYTRSNATDLKPEIIRDWVSFPAAAALTRGNLVQINATPNIAALVAASVLDGVLLEDAALGATAVAVRDGEVFVDTNAVAAGDYLRADAGGTPTRAITAALGALVLGQTVGRALEATGATNAGESYSSVRTR